jgi:hypothetical protein
MAVVGRLSSVCLALQVRCNRCGYEAANGTGARAAGAQGFPVPRKLVHQDVFAASYLLLRILRQRLDPLIGGRGAARFFRELLNHLGHARPGMTRARSAIRHSGRNGLLGLRVHHRCQSPSLLERSTCASGHDQHRADRWARISEQPMAAVSKAAALLFIPRSLTMECVVPVRQRAQTNRVSCRDYAKCARQK